MGLSHLENWQQSKFAAQESSVSINMDGLPISTVLNNKDSTPSPRFQKLLTRKGSNRGGGGGEELKAVEDDTTGGPGTCETISLLVHVDSNQEPHDASSGGRRLGRRESRWLGPRRVLLLFATLSSMGTLILLYFTLSISKMDSGDSNIVP